MSENKPNNDNITKAFEPDYLSRKALVEEWTDALLSTKINHHLVISVSGDWGTGKTYLAKNWHKYLGEQEYFTCYIDAHKKDYAEDPLLIIMSEIESAVNKYIKKEEVFIKRAFTPVKRKFFPFIASGLKTAGKVGASMVLPDIISSGVKQIIDEVDAEIIKEFVKSSIETYGKKKDNFIKQYYKNIQAYSKNIEEFKQALEKFADTIADKLNKPVVIFIDELDRSNPKFVIKLIEQLKHIFEIPNLAFILTVNKKELSNTIKGIYGSEMDGYAYYKKFVTHDFTLYTTMDFNSYNINMFIKKTFEKYKLFDIKDEFLAFATSLSKTLNLSLRDIEQIISHLFYIKEKVISTYHKDYLIVCFFYRAIYINTYSVFLDNKEKFEYLYGENPESVLTNNDEYGFKIKNQINKIDSIFKGFIYKFDMPLNIKILFSIIIRTPRIKDLESFYNKYQPLLQNINLNETICPNVEKYDILFPILSKCKNINDVKIRIREIRISLIQLSMLGAVPDNNIIK